MYLLSMKLIWNFIRIKERTFLLLMIKNILPTIQNIYDAKMNKRDAFYFFLEISH